MWQEQDSVIDRMSDTTTMEYTAHARRTISERMIHLEWVERAISEPDLRADDPDDIEIERFYKRISEQDDRVLRVAVNTRVTPWRIVRVFFDRGMRMKL